MKCSYCKQKLNLFKSLAGSSFCSPEHQKLYEQAEASKGFERLLQFVERDAKPTSPAKPAAPPPAANVEVRPAPPVEVPEPQTIAAKAEKTPDSTSEPPMGGFLQEPVASPAASASPGLKASFEIPEAGFPAESPALPSFRFEIAPEDLQKQTGETPPPPSTWSNVSPMRIDSGKTVIEVASVSSVRPRAIDLAVPSAESHAPTTGGLHGRFFSDSSALQVSVQAVIDTREFAHLARLNALPGEPRTVNEIADLPAAKLGVPALPKPDAKAFSVPSPLKDSREVAIGMSGAMTRTGVGRKISPPAARGPATQSTLAGLPRPALANLNFGQTDQPVAVAMNGAMTRAGVAKAVRQPPVASSRFVNTLGSNQILIPLSTGVQNAARQRGCSTLPPRPVQRECVRPEGERSMRESAAGIPPVFAHRKLIIRERDTAVARGITDVNKPAAVSSPLFVPNAPGFRRSIKVAAERAVREILMNVQARGGSQGCAISDARPTRRDCLLPVFLWSAEAWLGSAAASVGWFHETDCAVEAIASGAPSPRQFSIRFAPESLSTDMPVLARDRISRQLALAVCEWKAEAQRLARSQPSRTSPLSLVARPQTGATTLAVRQIAKLNRFGSIVNPAYGGAVTSGPVSAGVDEHKFAMSLPQLVGYEPALPFRLASHASLKSPSLQPTPSTNPDNTSRPQPSPLRVQPASMLVLPGSSITIRRIRWVARGGWATVASPSLPKQEHAVSSSKQTAPSSLRSLADVVGVDRNEMRESAALRLNPKRPVITLGFGAQTSTHGVPAANALPRRSGPTLPVVKAQLDDLTTARR
jgi:hypothetical protein